MTQAYKVLAIRQPSPMYVRCTQHDQSRLILEFGARCASVTVMGR